MGSTQGPGAGRTQLSARVRGYGDLDLLVSCQQLREAAKALASVGALFTDRNWPLLIKDGTGELAMALPGTPYKVDLHWHLVNQRGARQRFRLPSDEVLGRRGQARLGAVEAWALEPSDFAIHLALHAAFPGKRRLRRLVDNQRTLANQPPDWQAFVTRCQAWRVHLPVSALLSRARRTLGAAVPSEVLRSLEGGYLNHLSARKLSDGVPSGRLPGGRSVTNTVTHSFRDGLWPSAIDCRRVLAGYGRPAPSSSNRERRHRQATSTKRAAPMGSSATSRWPVAPTPRLTEP